MKVIFEFFMTTEKVYLKTEKSNMPFCICQSLYIRLNLKKADMVNYLASYPARKFSGAVFVADGGAGAM